MTTPATILVVEDETSIASFIAAYLRNAGYAVKTAATAQAALIQLVGDSPALIILDLNLPGDTGWDLLRGPALAAVDSPPVIITSATSVSPKLLAEFRCAGYLPKPFPLDTLEATIERLMRPTEALTDD